MNSARLDMMMNIRISVLKLNDTGCVLIPLARCVLLNKFFSNAFCSLAEANVLS